MVKIQTCMGSKRALLVAFQKKNMQCTEIKYSIGIFDPTEKSDFLTILFSPLLSFPSTLAFLSIANSKFLIDLVMGLVITNLNIVNYV